HTNLNPRYNFSNFVVGACNQFAHAACLKAAENPGSAYNPLFIYGGVGLGKTHLANAIGNACRRRNLKVLLTSSETFVSELISSLKTNNMDRFKSKFRSLDVLIIDDIQFIIGKERTQEEFFHTFNELYNRRKQIVITADKVPQELTGLEERLRTRFASGLSADIQPPDFETRVAILAKKSETDHVSLPTDVVRLIAERIDTNVRELEGALVKLKALCSVYDAKPSVTLVEEMLRSIAPARKIEASVEVIQKAVANRYSVSVGDLLGKRRTHNIAFARQVAMYLSRKLAGRSYPEIGALFGGRDHSTVIHACKVIVDRIAGSNDFNTELRELERSLMV
ncbi:MAG TPA: chromosomal replication initiator protein DnaA, partial [Oligoflexia bacterium]|nr:chromosomal replication initiator protein DnaA [Oligoflexia bacterium]